MVATKFDETPEDFPSAGLPEPYASDLRDVWFVWQDNRSRNSTLRSYYEGENRLKNIGIAIPPELEGVQTVVGWPRKAVEALANLSVFDGFTSVEDASEINSIADDNAFAREYRRMTPSELVHGVAFATVSRGASDEPPVCIRYYSAQNAACTWDYRLRRIKCGLTVHDTDGDGNPTRYILYEPHCIIELSRGAAGRWDYTIEPHPMGRPPMEPLVYNADLDCPLGHSRITRALMNITDRAVRESLRREIASEFAATPQKYLLGGTKKDKEEAVKGGTRWEMYIGSVFWATKDRDGDVPQFGQLPQVSMEPHSTYFKDLAQEFASEANISVDELMRSTVYTSKDSSDANNEKLVRKAEVMNDDNGAALQTIARMALAVRRNAPLSVVRDSIIPVFRDPSRPSDAAEADFMVKAVSVFPALAGTEFALEKFGFRRDERVRIESEMRRAAAQARMAQAATEAANGEEQR